MDLTYPDPFGSLHRWQWELGWPRPNSLLLSLSTAISVGYTFESENHMFSFILERGSSIDFKMFLLAVRAKFGSSNKASSDFQEIEEQTQDTKSEPVWKRIIPDAGDDWKILEMWDDKYTAPEIERSLNKGKRTVTNRLSKLRKWFPDANIENRRIKRRIDTNSYDNV